MSVKSKIASVINHNDFLSYILALTLSIVLVGYAPSSIALVLFVFFVLRYVFINKTKFKLSTPLFLPILLFIVCCTSYFWSVDQDITLKGIGRLSILLVVPLAFSVLPKFSYKSFRIVLDWFTISNIILGAFFLIVAIIKYFKYGNASVFTYHSFVEILDLNAIYVSVFFAFSYFYILSKRVKKRIDYFGLFFLGMIILLLSSKTITATFFLGNIIYFFVHKGIGTLKSPKTIGLLLIAITVLAITSHKIVNRILTEKTTNLEEVLSKERFNQVYPWTGTSIRLLQLRNLKGQIEEDGIFWKGFGLFASRDNLRERHLAFNTYYGYHGYNYHNMYAQILSELGIFGLLILLVILGLGFKKSFKEKSFLMFMFYFLITMVFITESFLWVHRGVFLFVIMNCMFHRIDFSEIKHELKE